MFPDPISPLLCIDASGLGCNLSLTSALLPYATEAHASSQKTLSNPALLATYQDAHLHGFSERFPQIIQNILQQAHLSLDTLGGFAIASGPGSFTGIRSALAFMRALARTRHLPLYHASTFRCWHANLRLHQPLAPNDICLSILDTRRADFYCAFHTHEGHALGSPAVHNMQGLENFLNKTPFVSKAHTLWLVGDISPADKVKIRAISPNIHLVETSHLTTLGLSQIAWASALTGQAPSPALPYYLRDAEAQKPRFPGLQQLGLALNQPSITKDPAS